MNHVRLYGLGLTASLILLPTLGRAGEPADSNVGSAATTRPTLPHADYNLDLSLQPITQPASEPVAASSPANPTSAPLTPWDRWQAIKDDIKNKYGTDFAITSNSTFRAAVAGPDTDVNAAVERLDFIVTQSLGKDTRVRLDVRRGWGEGLEPKAGIFGAVDPYVVGAAGVNTLFVRDLDLEQFLANEQLTLRIGKFDISDYFDFNRYTALDPFGGYVQAPNGTIPFPGATLSAMVWWEPKDGWYYLGAGVSNASQTPYESGFTSPLDAWFYIAEGGIKAKPFGREGIYRLIGWYDTADFATTGGGTVSGAEGFALDFDQDITQRLGAFFRYGVVNDDPFEPSQYYAGGLYLKEPIPGRKDDGLGFGVVVNQFTSYHSDTVADSAPAQIYYELYYNLQLTPWAGVSPWLQYVQDPGGVDESPYVILGFRLGLRF